MAERYLTFKKTKVESETIDLNKVIQVYKRSGGGPDVNGGSWKDWWVEVKTYYTSSLKEISESKYKKIVEAMGKKLIGSYHIKYIRGYKADKYGISLWYGDGRYGLQTSMDLKHLPALRKKLPKLELKGNKMPKEKDVKEDWD